jgi:hypothetical protein
VCRTFEAFVPIVLVDEDVVYTQKRMSLLVQWEAHRHRHSLRWFSLGARVGGAKVKLCICAVCGNSGRPAFSPGMLAPQSSTVLTGNFSRAMRQLMARGVVVLRGRHLVVRSCCFEVRWWPEG